MAELKTMKKLDETSGQLNQIFYDLHPHLEPTNGVPVSKNVVGPATNTVPEPHDLKQEMSKIQIVKNLLVLSLGFLFLFTAFSSMSNLQSSVNLALGTLSLSAIYAGLVFSCMFVPSVMIGLLGQKFTVAVSMLMYSFYFIANFYPRWYTLIPASLLMGLGGAPLWTAKASYLTTIAQRYAVHVGQPSEAFVVPFFGFFFMIFQTSQIWGNLISYKILTPTNSDQESLDSNHSQCGPLFSYDLTHDVNDTDYSVSSIPENFNLLCGVYTGCALMAALIVFVFLDRLDKKTDRVVRKPSLATLLMTMKHLKKPYQILLIPLTTFSGMGLAYISGDFTQAYVTCGWGVNYVGYVMICYGVTNAVCCFALGIKMKPLGRLIVILSANSITGALIVLMFFWVPTSDNRTIYFVIAGLWGVGDAVWATYINAFHGVLFPQDKDAAFSNFVLWKSVGFIVAYAYSNYLSIPVKLAILVVFLIIGSAGYLAVEIHLRLTRNKLLEDTSSHPPPQSKDNPDVQNFISC